MIELLFFLVFIAGIGVGSILTFRHVQKPINKTISAIQHTQLNIRHEELRRRERVLVDENYKRSLEQ